MFEAFQRSFARDSWCREGGGVSGVVPISPALISFFDQFGGISFNDGLYRIIHPADLPDWQKRIHLAFPEFEGRVTCYGFDWLGSVFALDNKRMEDDQASVLMFEIGTGQVLEIPSNLESFHERGLMEFGEAALAISFHEKWLNTGGAAPHYDQCIGYKMPLFLGGKDEVENLETSDIDVYWHLIGQLVRKAKGLPEGTPVHVSLDD